MLITGEKGRGEYGNYLYFQLNFSIKLHLLWKWSPVLKSLYIQPKNKKDNESSHTKVKNKIKKPTLTKHMNSK